MEFLEFSQRPSLEEKARRVRLALSDASFRCFRLCRFEAGEFLYTEGARAGYLLVLLAGGCKVFKTLENGRSVLLCRYDDVQVLGEFELFGEPTAKTNVQALTEVYCLAAFVREQREQLLADNAFLRFVCRKTCAKTERNNVNLTTNLLYPLEQRLAGYVLAMRSGAVFSANHTMLAEYLGCSLRHLLRTLRGLCDKGLLQKTTAGYRLTDIPTLEQIAGAVYRQ